MNGLLRPVARVECRTAVSSVVAPGPTEPRATSNTKAGVRYALRYSLSPVSVTRIRPFLVSKMYIHSYVEASVTSRYGNPS